MRGLDSYRQNRVFSAPNEQVVVMLFEMAITRLESAREAMEGGERGARVKVAEDFGVVRSIYLELLNALDPEAAPEMVKNLALTYSWVVRRLGELGREHNVEGVNGLIRVSQTLLEAFRHAADHCNDAAEAG